MATRLDKALKREIEVEGKLYTATISPDGIKVVEKGKRNGHEIAWTSIIRPSSTRAFRFTSAACFSRPAAS